MDSSKRFSQAVERDDCNPVSPSVPRETVDEIDFSSERTKKLRSALGRGAEFMATLPQFRHIDPMAMFCIWLDIMLPLLLKGRLDFLLSGGDIPPRTREHEDTIDIPGLCVLCALSANDLVATWQAHDAECNSGSRGAGE